MYELSQPVSAHELTHVKRSFDTGFSVEQNGRRRLRGCSPFLRNSQFLLRRSGPLSSATSRKHTNPCVCCTFLSPMAEVGNWQSRKSSRPHGASDFRLPSNNFWALHRIPCSATRMGLKQRPWRGIRIRVRAVATCFRARTYACKTFV